METERFDATIVPKADDQLLDHSKLANPPLILDPSAGSSNDVEINAGVTPPEIPPVGTLAEFHMKAMLLRLNFCHQKAIPRTAYLLLMIVIVF